MFVYADENICIPIRLFSQASKYNNNNIHSAVAISLNFAHRSSLEYYFTYTLPPPHTAYIIASRVVKIVCRNDFVAAGVRGV